MELTKKEISFLHELLNAHNGRLVNFGKKTIAADKVQEQEMTLDLMYRLTDEYLSFKGN
jgi:hypothetical protein